MAGGSAQLWEVTMMWCCVRRELARGSRSWLVGIGASCRSRKKWELIGKCFKKLLRQGSVMRVADGGITVGFHKRRIRHAWLSLEGGTKRVSDKPTGASAGNKLHIC